MLETLKSAWKVTELRNKILYTVFMLLVYRVLCFIPAPGVDYRMIQSAGHYLLRVTDRSVDIDFYACDSLSPHETFNLKKA